MNTEEQKDPLEGREDLQKALMDILSEFDTTEYPIRSNNVKVWKKCENYWHHIQTNYWSTVSNDWREPEFFYQNNPDANIPIDDTVDPKVVNIYRAHGESIVAALSVNTPTTRFFPYDADSVDDILASKGRSKLAKMIERQNKSKLLLMRMIYILFNQGLVAVNNYSHESEDYGTREKQIKDTKDAHYSTSYCNNCGDQLESHGPSFDGPIDIPQQSINCQSCGNEGIPETEQEVKPTEYIADTEEVPKIRQIIKAYGPLNVKISSYAYDQKAVGILVLDAEQDINKVKDMYPNVADKIRTGVLNQEVAVNARMPNNLYDSYHKQQVTVRQVWLRPWQFNAIAKTGDPNTDERVLALKKLFPKGCCFHAINDTYAESYPEKLDDRWSLSFNPLSRYLQGDPIGVSLLPIQDMTNEMINLELQSIEFGVPETWVDPEVVDLDEYKRARGGPGVVFPAKPLIPGGNLSSHFFNNKQATLTDEAGRFEQRLEGHAQFISGDYPSIYGGPNQGDTAAEYSMSRQQALQRLSITWTIINFLWADVMKRATDGYIANLEEDEHYVDLQGNDFINIWIKKSELTGKVGEVFPEASEQFPLSWAQQREVILQLLQQQNPLIDAVIADPNNRSKIAELIGLQELIIPGDQDRLKQLNEISKLILEQPSGGWGAPPMPSVMPEDKVDDDDIHVQTCKHWLNSEVGQYFKEEKPSAYMNVVLHMEAHLFKMEMAMSQVPNPSPTEQTQ